MRVKADYKSGLLFLSPMYYKNYNMTKKRKYANIIVS